MLTKANRDSIRYDEQEDDFGVFVLNCTDYIFDGIFPDLPASKLRCFRKRILMQLVYGEILE